MYLLELRNIPQLENKSHDKYIKTLLGLNDKQTQIKKQVTSGIHRWMHTHHL